MRVFRLLSHEIPLKTTLEYPFFSTSLDLVVVPTDPCFIKAKKSNDQ